MCLPLSPCLKAWPTPYPNEENELNSRLAVVWVGNPIDWILPNFPDLCRVENEFMLVHSRHTLVPFWALLLWCFPCTVPHLDLITRHPHGAAATLLHKAVAGRHQLSALGMTEG